MVINRGKCVFWVGIKQFRDLQIVRSGRNWKKVHLFPILSYSLVLFALRMFELWGVFLGGSSQLGKLDSLKMNKASYVT